MTNMSHVVAISTKSPVLAFMLVILFGPFGFLYVSIIPALLLMVLYAVVFIMTVGIGLIILPFLNVILAIVGAVVVSMGNRGKMNDLSSQFASS